MPDKAGTQYDRPFVREGADSKSLFFALSETQSKMDLEDPDALRLEYTRTMMGFLLFAPAPTDIAMIGLGGGSLAKFCYRQLPDARITVVEINPHVLALREAFKVPADGPRFEVIQGDGANFVRDPPRLFDVLLADGYEKRGLPVQLSSQSFYDDTVDMLKPGGILVVNLHADHRHYARHIERIKRSYDGAALVVVDPVEGNTIVFAKSRCASPWLRLRTPRRPPTLDETAWQSLQGACSRILAAARAHGT